MDSKKIKLTDFSRFAGCGAKLGPSLLDKALCGLSQPHYPQVLADFHGSEDAGVYQLTEELALVQTIDFFPPIVDDPYLFGQIAAANALSDIYAMGAKPISGVSVLCYPEEELGLDHLRAIMEGGLSKLKEAEVALLGGHSVNDRELKFGFCINGTIHPEKAIKNNTPRVGDLLILTKPLGTGVINTAQKAELASYESIEAAQNSMATLNRKGTEALEGLRVSSCTDITGFGLIGHMAEMVQNSSCTFKINWKDLPLLPEVMNYIAMGLVPRGTYKNREFRKSFLSNKEELSPEQSDLLFDPQTSGGLLIAIKPEEAPIYLDRLKKEGINGSIIGEIIPGKGDILVK